MDIAEKKLDLISWLSRLEDPETLSQLAEIKEEFLKQRYENSLKPMSLGEFRDSLSEAERDYAQGRILSQDELEQRIKAGRVL